MRAHMLIQSPLANLLSLTLAISASSMAMACGSDDDGNTGVDADSGPGGSACGFADRYLPFDVGNSWTYRVTNLGTPEVATKSRGTYPQTTSCGSNALPAAVRPVLRGVELAGENSHMVADLTIESTQGEIAWHTPSLYVDRLRLVTDHPDVAHNSAESEAQAPGHRLRCW